MNFSILTLPFILLFGAVASLLIGLFMQGERAKTYSFGASLITLIVAFAVHVNMPYDQGLHFFGLIKITAQSIKFCSVLLFIALLLQVFIYLLWKDTEAYVFEIPALTLFALLGMVFMAIAADFLTLYLGMEIQSLALYVLVAHQRDRLAATEAGLKYFILGALASAIFLFGVSFYYGVTGTTSLDFVQVTDGPLLMIAMTFILSAILFKLSAVPFHMWTPDVYQGAPIHVTAILSSLPKVAAVIALLAVIKAFLHVKGLFELLAFIAILTIFMGALAAVMQQNLRRLMAFSTVANMGFVILALLCFSAEGEEAALFYTLAYVFMSLPIFALLLTKINGRYIEQWSDIAGLAALKPRIAHVMAANLFSIAGIPPFIGFFAKYNVLKALVGRHLYVLAILAVLASAVAAYYYLKMIKTMYFDEAEDKTVDISMPKMAYVLALVLVLVQILFFAVPDRLWTIIF